MNQDFFILTVYIDLASPASKALLCSSFQFEKYYDLYLLFIYLPHSSLQTTMLWVGFFIQYEVKYKIHMGILSFGK